VVSPAWFVRFDPPDIRSGDWQSAKPQLSAKAKAPADRYQVTMAQALPFISLYVLRVYSQANKTLKPAHFGHFFVVWHRMKADLCWLTE
jgi:hypothetical protein